MENEAPPSRSFVQKLNFTASPLKIFLIVLIAALVVGVGTGYILASNSSKGGGALPIATTAPKSAQQDASTFKDFAEGVIQPKPSPKNGQDQYSEGAYLLIRQDNPNPVALTSSVVDLSQYVGKKVKVYGETQQAIQAGWLMDVGRVDVE